MIDLITYISYIVYGECRSDNICKYIYDYIWSIISLCGGPDFFNTCGMHVMNVIIQGLTLRFQARGPQRSFDTN